MADAMQAIIETHRAALVACASEDDALGPLNTSEMNAFQAFISAPCLTPEDVQAKVAYLTDSERLCHWVEDGLSDPLGFLRSLRLPPASDDPMLALVTALRQGEAEFDATCKPLSDEETDALSAATWQPHYVALRDATPATTTLRGAAEGIRVVLKEEDGQMRDDTFTVNVLRSVLAFLDGEAS